MLTISELKTWVHRDLTKSDKLLLLLASINKPCKVTDIRTRGKDAGLRAVRTWNVSAILARTKGFAINTPAGWELSDAGKQHLRGLGVAKISPAAIKVATDLRALLWQITDSETHTFVDEAVQCYELEFYRSAIVMSWLAAVHVLKKEVHQRHLVAFNTEARRIDAKWRPATTMDDLGLMKESNFLDRLVAISMVGKNVKDELQTCLKLRNACGHPSSLKVSTNAAANHLEILLLNVFDRFC